MSVAKGTVALLNMKGSLLCGIRNTSLNIGNLNWIWSMTFYSSIPHSLLSSFLIAKLLPVHVNVKILLTSQTSTSFCCHSQSCEVLSPVRNLMFAIWCFLNHSCFKFIVTGPDHSSLMTSSDFCLLWLVRVKLIPTNFD